MWYIGQEIVAVKSHIQGAFKEGDIFIIRGLKKSFCVCGYIVIDIGISDNSFTNIRCRRCNTIAENPSGIWWFDERNFAPLESIDISEALEVLNEKPFEV